MLSNKPYLIRAFYDWILDSKCTPVIAINAEHPKCKIPKEFSGDKELVFNISPEAVRDLKLGKEIIEFRASFTTVVHLISIPVNAILAIYAHENNEGMYFDYDESVEDMHDSDTGTGANTSVDKGKRKSHLQLVE